MPDGSGIPAVEPPQRRRKPPAGQIARNRYGRYLVPEGLESRPACKAVLAGGVYESLTIDLMRRHAGQGDIVHAGTFFGEFLPALSQSLAPGARLWAFEPNPGSYACAAETIALNGLENVTLTNAALSDAEGEILFQTHDAEGNPLGGRARFAAQDGPGVTAVPSVMLDFVVPLERPVSVLQLDVEGHEKSALRGAYHIIRAWKPILVLEYFAETAWVARNFRDLGYEPRGKLQGNVIYATGPVTLIG